MSVKAESWEAKAAAKRSSIIAKIPKEWILDQGELDKASKQRDLTGPFIEQYLTAEETMIIHQDSVSIANNIRDGKLKAVQVARAFCKTAAIAHQINNCLHEIFFDQALQRAQELDEHLAGTGTTSGPLHGLPVSLKDQFHVKGVDTTMGYVGWIGNYEGKDDPKLVHQVNSQIVTELLSLGAVLYCKTSLPQTLMIGETANNIIGTTFNPSNQNLSCGGSSGGEAALQALRGSSVGLGTDIGGSVRIPAASCGTYSLKPTHTRLSYRDVANTIPGETTYASSVGVMGTSLDALHLLMTSILSTQPWLRDPNVVNMPWRQHLVDETLSRTTAEGFSNDSKPLKIGIYWTDMVITPHPPITRGLHLVVDAVKKAGHKVVEWQPPPQEIAARVHWSFIVADGGHDVHKQLNLSGEPLIPQQEEPFRLRDPISLLEYHALTVEGRDYEAAYCDYWNSTAEEDGQIVDAVIMPVAPHAAVIPGKYFSAAYTEAINLLDYSAVVIPVTRANKELDKPEGSFTPMNDMDAQNWAAYDPETYDGAPVGIQLVARKYEEEKIWAIGKVVHTILGMRR